MHSFFPLFPQSINQKKEQKLTTNSNLQLHFLLVRDWIMYIFRMFTLKPFPTETYFNLHWTVSSRILITRTNSSAEGSIKLSVWKTITICCDKRFRIHTAWLLFLFFLFVKFSLAAWMITAEKLSFFFQWNSFNIPFRFSPLQVWNGISCKDIYFLFDLE